MAEQNKYIERGITERRIIVDGFGDVGVLNDEIKSEWMFWRPYKLGKVTLHDYETITYPELLKINALLDMDEAYKLADEGKRAFAADLERLKNIATG